MEGCLLLLVLGLAVGAMIIATSASRHFKTLSGELAQLKTQIAALERELRRRPRSEAAEPPVEAPPFQEPHVTPAEQTATPVPQPPLPEPAPPAMPTWASSVSADTLEMEPTPPVDPLPPPPPPPPPPVAAAPPVRPFDWESLVGVKLFSWIAGVALVLAAVFFLKYSVEHGWLSPTVRATLGLITGVVLIAVCEMKVARGFAFTANAMHGAGIAILYATLFAIHGLWQLLPAGVVFALMLVVTAVAVMLSIRRDSVFIALLGLMGGFATPALLSSGQNRPVELFSYLLLLNGGLAWVAYRKRWVALTFGSLIFTLLYQWVWIANYLTASTLPLAAAIFAVFALVGSAVLWMRGTARDDHQQPHFERVALTAAVLPMTFAVFGAAVPAYGLRYNTLFGFLLFMAAGLAVIAWRRGPQWLHVLGGAGVLLTFAVWISVSYRSAAWPGVLGWVAAFVVLYLAAATRFDTKADRTAALLFFVFPVLAAREPVVASPATLFTALFILLVLVSAYAVRYRAGAVYLIAAFLAIVTQAVWSSRHLTRETLLPALLIYGVFGLLFLGVPVLARRAGRAIEPAWGVPATVLLSLAVLFFLTGEGVAPAAIWGLALLLSIVMAGLFHGLRVSRLPGAALAGVVLGWLVLASWWGAAPLASSLLGGLFLVALFGVIVIAGSVWSGSGDEPVATAHLAIAGHLFLMFVASQRDLAIPPWAIFAVLGILNLAIGTAALYLRRGTLVTGAAIASHLLAIVWVLRARIAPWPDVALVLTLVVAAWAVLWYYLARRQDESSSATFFQAAVAALLGGHVVAMVSGVASVTPLFGTLLLTHLALAITVLAVARLTETHTLATILVPLLAMATALHRAETPGRQLAFAASIYALFIAYPFVLGDRARRALHPYLAAVLASVPFFFFARAAIVEAGYGSFIGVLPVVQALVMLVLVVHLVRMGALSEETRGRLALVAAAALAFITVAIPLQLEKQWITIGWALLGAALVWLYRRIPHRGLLFWSGGLLAIVFVRLVFNPAVFSYYARSATPIVNWYLYTYLVAALAFFAAARLLPREFPRSIAASAAAGTLVLFILVNIEIADFYAKGPFLTFNFFTSTLAHDLTYTMAWALFAVALLIAGISLQARAARISALSLLAVTILKCFLHDLGRLGGLYRVGSLLALAVSLVVVGLLLQKFVLRRPAGEAT